MECGSEGPARAGTRREGVLRALLVGADAGAAAAFRLQLELDGYAVEVAGDYPQAAALAARTRPDFVFLDIRRPRAEAIWLVEEMRRLVGDMAIPLVLVSDENERQLAGHGLRLDAHHYVIRAPVVPAERIRDDRESGAAAAADDAGGSKARLRNLDEMERTDH
ncbi:MAG: response regulator [Candidatus Dormibacteraceae bacterium]